jgi:hypothetical protein
MLRHNPGLWECAFLFVFLLHLSQAARLFPAEAGPCFVNFQLAAQRVLTDDDVISTTLFAGHQGSHTHTAFHEPGLCLLF